MTAPALEVSDLTVTFGRGADALTIVRGVSFELARGQRLGLVGESGSGKTLTALSLMGLLPRSARAQGSIRIAGREIVGADDETLRSIRGRDVAMVFQNPMSALNPTRRVGDLLIESIRHHTRMSRSEARSRAIALLEEVGIADAARRLSAYPYEFSGGMKQRVCIALALTGDPGVIIADEATTALDVTTQARVIDLLRGICEARGTAVIFVTHDLALATEFCTDIQVMYAGRVVERRATREFYARAEHPYTRGLLDSHCGPELPLDEPIRVIAGQPPALTDLPSGCSFRPRCGRAVPECERIDPQLVAVGGGLVACPVVVKEEVA